jgi:hypothetical protein
MSLSLNLNELILIEKTPEPPWKWNPLVPVLSVLTSPVSRHHRGRQTLGSSAASEPLPPKLGQDSVLEEPQCFYRIVIAADLLYLGPILFINHKKLFAHATFPFILTQFLSQPLRLREYPLRY